MKEFRIYLKEFEIDKIKESHKKKYLVEIEKIILQALQEHEERKKIYFGEEETHRQQQQNIKQDIKKYEESRGQLDIGFKTADNIDNSLKGGE